MIRRDYILRMLEEFFEVLARMRSLKKARQWEEASQLAEKELQRLIGLDAKAVAKLSETELLARLIRGESTLAVREKSLMVATLLKEAGDLAAGQNQLEQSRLYYLKGLHLLLGVLAHEQVSDVPELVPRIDLFLNALADTSLSLRTMALLMQYYEGTGEFGKAEDMLFGMLEEEPENVELLNFGASFYRRLQSKSDDALTDGNLPRSELEASLAQLSSRAKARHCGEERKDASLNSTA